MEENPYASPLQFERLLTPYDVYRRRRRMVGAVSVGLMGGIGILASWYRMKMVNAGIPGPTVDDLTIPIMLLLMGAISVLEVGIWILMAVQYHRENPDAPVFWFPRWRDPHWKENRRRRSVAVVRPPSR